MKRFNLIDTVLGVEKSRNSLNLELQEKRLILIALLKTNFSVKRAFLLNYNYKYEVTEKVLINYRKLISQHFGGVNELKAKISKIRESNPNRVIKE